MAGQISINTDGDNKVFDVVVQEGDVVTMATQDTYVDKNIRITAQGSGSGYGDEDVKTLLESYEVTNINLAESSQITAQAVGSTLAFIAPAYTLSEWDSTSGEHGQFSEPYGGMYLQDTDAGKVVVFGTDVQDVTVALYGLQDRPYYIQATQEGNTTVQELAFTSDIANVVANPAGTPTVGLTKIKIGETLYTVGEALSKAKITQALGYTPYDEANPNGYLSTISYANVTSALGFVPYSSSNPNGYISGITSDDIKTALGYTPYNAANPNGYISGISKSDVTTALGYTPYNATNPNKYITKSVTDLDNYYDKAAISTMIGQGLQTKIVATLPTTDIQTNCIYMVPLTDGREGYAQWMYIENKWESLGTTNISLAEYAKTAELSEVAKSGSYTSLTDKPTIPTDLGDLSNSAGYVKADTGALVQYTKTADLASVAITGSYADLSNKPAIPTSLGELTNDANYITNADLSTVNVSVFTNDCGYAKLSDITALQELDVDQIKEAIAVTQNVGTIKGVIAGTGLTGGGETGKVTLNHSNEVTAKTDYASNDTSVASGASFTITDIKYDANGHITSSRDRSITIPEIPDTAGMLTSTNYADTLTGVYQPAGSYQAAGDYLTPTNAVNDNTGNYVSNVTQDTRGQITVTKGTLPTLSEIEDASPDTPTTNEVTVLEDISTSGHTITKNKVKVVSKTYIDTLVGNINAILDEINGEVI